MLLCVIIILVSILIIVISCCILKEDNGLLICCGIWGIILGILSPFDVPIPEGTSSTSFLLEEIELVSLSNNNDYCFYVSVSSDNFYTYKYKIISDFDTESSNSYNVTTLTSNDIINDIIEIEDKNCTKPVLRIYDVTYDATLWTYKRTVKQYVFYVPEGTISKDVQLN